MLVNEGNSSSIRRSNDRDGISVASSRGDGAVVVSFRRGERIASLVRLHCRQNDVPYNEILAALRDKGDGSSARCRKMRVENCESGSSIYSVRLL